MCWRPRLRSSAHARWLIRGNQRTPEECEFPAGGLVPQVRVPPLDANLGSERPAPVHPSSSAHDHSPSTPIRSKPQSCICWVTILNTGIEYGMLRPLCQPREKSRSRYLPNSWRKHKRPAEPASPRRFVPDCSWLPRPTHMLDCARCEERSALAARWRS